MEGNPLSRVPSFILLALSMLAPASATSLLAHVDTDRSVPGVWSYTVFNDELLGSTQYIAHFFILVDAPITVTGTPVGWVSNTDSFSYVQWASADGSLPYPHDIAPGSSLAGFQISSPDAISVPSIAVAEAWDHRADTPGAISDAILVDAPMAVPEPGGAWLAPLLLLVFHCRLRVQAARCANR